MTDNGLRDLTYMPPQNKKQKKNTVINQPSSLPLCLTITEKKKRKQKNNEKR